MASRVDAAETEYLHSPIFWVLMISAPIVWALAYYLLAEIFTPLFR